MLNKSLRDLVKDHKQIEELEGEQKELSELDKKLQEEAKENYEGWLNDPITQKVAASLQEEIIQNNTRLLTHCLGTGIDRPVEDRKVLYYSLKNKICKELLRNLGVKDV